jgi:UDP-glucose 4-epimerase
LKIDGSKILLTGGCGLVGSTTLDLLLEEHAPQQIVIVDDMSRGVLSNIEHAIKDPRVSLVEGDICDAELMNSLAAGMDAVIHMAAIRITACAEQPRRAFQVMCEGTFNVVDAARQAQVQKVIAASSASIYGHAASFPTTEEDHPYNNRTWYGASKMMLEGLLRSYNDMYQLPYVALRYFNVYGPRMDIYGKYTEVLIRWMERINGGKPPLIFGDGKQTMDFVHIEDVARANIYALQSDVSDEVFNIASGEETSLNELAFALLRAMDSNLAPEYGPERSVNPVPRRLADTTKAQRLLGYRTSIGLDDGLRGLVDWWRDSRKRDQSR